VIAVSGDAGFRVEEFCRWLNVKGFFYIFRIKKNAGNIFLRVSDRASCLMGKNPHGDFYQSVHCGSDEIHSRILWRIPGLYHAVYPGIREGSVIRKTDLQSLKTELRYFITNRPPNAWNARSVIDRILIPGQVFPVSETIHSMRTKSATNLSTGNVPCIAAELCMELPFRTDF